MLALIYLQAWSVLLCMHIYINDAAGLHTAYGVKPVCVIICDSYGHMVLCQHSPSSSAALVHILVCGYKRQIGL